MLSKQAVFRIFEGYETQKNSHFMMGMTPDLLLDETT